MTSRRDFLSLAAHGLAAGALGSAALGRAALADSPMSNRILVVLELSGGNDGLNTVVPYGDDAYYRHRPRLGIKPDELLKIDEHFGLRKQMAGFERLYKAGQMAIVHGCGYAQPSYSHFTSMNYWHTGAPNSGEAYGWMGRLADQMEPAPKDHLIVNVDATQSLAVRSRRHTPVVFDDPTNFMREGESSQRAAFSHVADPATAKNDTQKFLRAVALSAQNASARVREAWRQYRTDVDYGLVHLDLPKVASLIEAKFPARLYYTSFRNNAFDTHVHQHNLHARLLTYTADAVSAFMLDLERIGRADDVILLVFSEFGRRVPENDNLGTDHGTANPMFVTGKPVQGGHYGALPDLVNLDDGDNLIFTTDFRRVYASVIQGWLGAPDTEAVLGGQFEPFAMFGT